MRCLQHTYMYLKVCIVAIRESSETAVFDITHEICVSFQCIVLEHVRQQSLHSAWTEICVFSTLAERV